MFSRKPKPLVCAVCGKPIAPKERRFVDKNRISKVERHAHVACVAQANPGAEPPTT